MSLRVLGGIFLTVIAALVASFVLPLGPQFQPVRSVTSPPGVHYDSHLRGPAFSATESVLQPLKSFSVSLNFTAYSTANYSDLFQTAPQNTGIRIETQGNSLGLIIGANNPSGYDAYLLSGNYHPESPHSLTVSVDVADHVSAILDGQTVLNTQSPDLDYAIAHIVVGRALGFPGNRIFEGRIANLQYSYAYYVPGSAAPLILWVRLGLFFAGLATLFLLVKSTAFTLASFIPVERGETTFYRWLRYLTNGPLQRRQMYRLREENSRLNLAVCELRSQITALRKHSERLSEMLDDFTQNVQH